MVKDLIKKNKVLMNIIRKIDFRYRILLSAFSPTLASKTLYKRAFGKKLNLNNPITFSEKLTWLKLNTYYNNSLVTMCADKYKVREHINNCGLNEMLNDLIVSVKYNGTFSTLT